MTNQQLKAHCEDVIANPQDHLDWVVDMARVALASQEAEPVFQAKGSNGWRDVHERVAIEVGNQGVPTRKLYDAPPVPELKPVKMPQRYTTRIGTDLVSGAEGPRVVMIPDEHGQWLSIYDVEHEFNRTRGIPS